MIDPSVTWTFTLNEADKIVMPIDRFFRNKNLIIFNQPERTLGGIHTVVIDIQKRTYSITTWDIKSNPNQGGSGYRTNRGQAFTSFDFTLRLDLDQVNGAGQKTSTVSVVTSTELSRKTTDDAFWQTGRKTNIK